MSDQYTEAGAKRQNDVKVMGLKALMITVIVVIFLAAMFLGSSILFVVGGVAIVGVVYLMPLLNVDYDYIYCDGQFDFDKIMGGNKRKHVLRIDLDDAEILAPMNSHALDGYTYQNVTVKKFSSGNKNAKVYALVGKDKDNKTIKVLFEPSEKMIKLAKQKSPRKVVVD